MFSGQVGKAAVHERNVSNVGDPDLIDVRWRRSIEEQVGAVPQRVTAVGGAGHEPLLLLCGNAFFPHDLLR